MMREEGKGPSRFVGKTWSLSCIWVRFGIFGASGHRGVYCLDYWFLFFLVLLFSLVCFSLFLFCGEEEVRVV